MESLILPPSSTTLSNDQLDRAYQVLESVPAENSWLANFMSNNTRDNYRRAVGQFIATMSIQSSEELYAVNKNHIIAYRDYLLLPSEKGGAGLSRAAVATKLSSLSSLYKALADERLCVMNPVSSVKRPKTGNGGLGGGKTPGLDRINVRKMLDAPLKHAKNGQRTLQALRDRAILHVFWYTGARCTEPTMLKIKDFREDRGYPILEFTVKGGKTNTVAINTECQLAIQEYLDVAGHGGHANEWLFKAVKSGRNTGYAISRIQFYRLFKKYVNLVGLPSEITPHSARATFITEAYEASVPGEDIQRTVSHASVTTTEGYNHTAKKHRKSASLAVHY
jgi:integrase/recombinase XerD